MGSLEKAEIYVRDFNNKEINKIKVLFNPEKYSVEKAAKWISKGKRIKTPHYMGTELQSFSVDLFFDTYKKKFENDEEEKDVRKYTDEIVSLMNPTVKYKGNKVPPICDFSWGKFVFRGVIEKVTQNFTLFLSTGIPVRAVLNVNFKPFIPLKEQAKGNPPGDPTKIRIV